MPLTATIAPARSAATAASSPAGVHPRAAGRARVRLRVEAAVARVVVLGLAGAHIAKPAIVVHGRSYGTPVTIVNRGPQSVQLMNG